MKNDDIEKNEKELWIRLYLKLEENEFLLIEISNKNELLISNMNYNDINYYNNFLINN